MEIKNTINIERIAIMKIVTYGVLCDLLELMTIEHSHDNGFAIVHHGHVEGVRTIAISHVDGTGMIAQ